MTSAKLNKGEINNEPWCLHFGSRYLPLRRLYMLLLSACVFISDGALPF